MHPLPTSLFFPNVTTLTPRNSTQAFQDSRYSYGVVDSKKSPVGRHLAHEPLFPGSRSTPRNIRNLLQTLAGAGRTFRPQPPSNAVIIPHLLCGRLV